MSDLKRPSLIKPSIKTPFHIDFAWWQENDRNWRVELGSMLCPEHQEAFPDNVSDRMLDWIDPHTAEVRQIDAIQHILISHCARQSDFLTEHTAMVDAVFRLLLANGNTPMTPEELGSRLNRPPDTILRTLAGVRVYKGLRPVSLPERLNPPL
ncbi:MAG: hypothetical protein FJZ96_05465 [Chloroflexi bacterium]|nr:hypothetical protein [Chloroflexota bacterium]